MEAFPGVVVGPDTLYGAITRLEEGGTIESLPSATPSPRVPEYTSGCYGVD
jgi:hypothetical protein